MSTYPTLSVLAWCLLASAPSSALAHADAYTAYDISEAHSANKKMVGYSVNVVGQIAGSFERSPAVTGPMGLGGGPVGFRHPESGAVAINNAGRAVGSIYNGNELGTSTAFVTPEDGGDLIPLGTLGGANSSATAINSNGQIVGYSTLGNGSSFPHAFVTTDVPGVLKDLGTLGGTQSYAFGINDSGVIVGAAYTASNERYAFITDTNGDNMHDLGPLSRLSSTGRAVNAVGQVVGEFTLPSLKQSAFITDAGGKSMRAVPTLNSNSGILLSINVKGEAVGAESDELGVTHAVVLGPNGYLLPLSKMVTLPGRVYLRDAYSINDLGDIVASGSNAHVYLLVPKKRASN